jgi:hypothetical protein
MTREFSLFVVTFTTLLAITNPFEVLPVYLKLLDGKDVETHSRVAGTLAPERRGSSRRKSDDRETPAYSSPE